MNRRSMLLVASFLAACQVADERTDQTRQAEEGGCKYCDAVMPPAPYYNGEGVPEPSATARFIMWQAKQGEWLVMLADPESKQVVWARKVDDDKLPTLINVIHGLDGLLDITRPPPPPPPPDGGDWIAPVALDMADTFNRAGSEAYDRWYIGCPLGGGYEPPLPPLK